MSNFIPDYKNPLGLAPYVSDSFAILPAVVKGHKASFQRRISQEIKRARYLALMPYCDQHF